MPKGTVKHYHDNFDFCYFIFVSLFVWAILSCSEACPVACNCISNQKWECTNITSLGDIWENSSRAVRELTLIHITDLNSFSDHLGTSFNASFESVRELRIQQSTINRVSALFIDSFPNVERVFLVDNQFSCRENILSLQRWESETSKDKLQCSSPDGMAKTELFLALKTISRVKEECPSPCRCVVKSMNSQYSVPNLLFNCSRSNLKVIPDSLPKSWVIELDLSHNQIEDATPLFSLPFYRNVPVLNLAHNHIQDIQVPNDTSQKNHFRLLNLSHNKLTQLPENLLGETDTFSYQPLIMLRSNPWMCDCNSVKMFQTIAMKQLHIIGDFIYLTCEGDLEGQLISSPTSLHRLCYVPAVAIMTIRCVNIVFFILIALVLIKTAFDLRSMYAVGIFHYFAHLLLLPSR
ncbi:protein singed wings 2-like isoform X2 [Daphnia pulex]|uniref:protein singed wings 2-like isoform X2 n=1 Tax=Daphnia pulex TaxID=6669 RepID=UPI001EDE306A|nr:protein singed wings 2-like isoform X2 [Daphnia pulex]XP_046451624.1 protein singed wings 2-like isoform X2 [Daphnia pulex]